MRAAFTEQSTWRIAAALLWLAGCSADDPVASESEDAGRVTAAGDAGSASSRDETGRAPDATSNGPVVVSSGKDDECNKLELAFGTPRPTVFILVDRSSSMFEQKLWEPLKAGVLEVVERLEADVSFGFSTYTGQQGGMCPELTTLDRIATNNYAAIKAAYDGLRPPTYKGETPTSRAIEEVTKVLADKAASASDTAASPTVILLVTDGEPDFCDDPNVTCSRDAVVAAVQAAQKQGIGTFIFSVGGQVDKAHLGDVANAGLGQPVVDRQNAVMQQCPERKGSYAASAGSAPFFEPNVNDPSALVNALANVVSSVRSCVFELQGKLEIDLSVAGDGVVELDGKRVPYNTADGFRMNSTTELELLGAACEQLKKPEAKRVSIDFPCEAILYL